MSRHKLSDPIDLDTMPFAGMMLLLIPLLLASAQFASLATVDASAPAVGLETSKPPAERLHLTVAVDPSGYRISAASAALPTLGLPPEGLYVSGAVDDAAGLQGLTEQLRTIKQAFPAEDAVILVPADDVPYHHVVAVMDASRSDTDGSTLFPAVAFGGMTH